MAKKKRQEWWEGGLFTYEELFLDKVDEIQNYIRGGNDETEITNDTKRARNLGQSNVRGLSNRDSKSNSDSSIFDLSTEFTRDTDTSKHKSTLGTDRQPNTAKRTRAQDGDFLQDLFLQTGQSSNISDATKQERFDENVFNRLSASTQSNRDVSIDFDDKWLRGGVGEFNLHQQLSNSNNSEQNSRTSDTFGSFEQTSKTQNSNDGILADAREPGDTILSRLQNSQGDISSLSNNLGENGDELGESDTSRSLQREFYMRRGNGINQSYTNTRSNSPSAPLYSDGNTTKRSLEVSYKFRKDDDAINKSLQSNLGARTEKNSTNADFNQSRIGENSNNKSDYERIISTEQNQDFIYTGEILVNSKKDRFYKNYEAIKLTKELTQIRENAIKNNHNFTITKEEQKIISQFTGWGGVAEVFDENREDFKKENRLLKNILTPKEYEQAKETINNAYFTPQILVNIIHNSLEQMGLNSDENQKRILEPSAGNGAFLKPNSKFDYTTIEKNPLSSQMLNLLFPNQTHHNLGFEEDLTNQNITKFDAIIGNPPFGKETLTEQNNQMREHVTKLSLHNFFATKSISYMLKDDGIMAFVISSDFMDAKDTKTREIINKQASFLGAVRLPEGIFDSTHTDVDIIFFQKNKDFTKSKNFIQTKNFQNTKHNINEYFLQNPQNILGKLEIDFRAYGENLVCVKDPQIDIKKSLDNFVQTLPKNIYKYHENQTAQNDVINLNSVINLSLIHI